MWFLDDDLLNCQQHLVIWRERVHDGSVMEEAREMETPWSRTGGCRFSTRLRSSLARQTGGCRFSTRYRAELTDNNLYELAKAYKNKGREEERSMEGRWVLSHPHFLYGP